MSDHLTVAGEYVEKVSPLESCSVYRPLNAGVNLVDRKLYVERHRDRGLGDLLFMTGVLDYIRHVSASTTAVYFYALSDRGAVVYNHPALYNRTPYYGPTLIDSLSAFDYHWVVPALTECNEETDQLNVYDALFRSVGLNPEAIDAKFKRPSAYLDDQDVANLDSLYYFIYGDHQVDLRRTPYYVVAPLCYSSLRAMPYTFWLKTIKELCNQRPVVVLGAMKPRLPEPDMSAADFVNLLGQIKGNNPIINLIGDIPLRLSMSLISRARCLVCLDSGPLYVAQAFRTPAISLWGNCHPGLRIGYDKEYMDTAIWARKACSHAPCFAYAGFPVSKCPRHEKQRTCEVLKTVEPDHVLAVLDAVEKSRPTRIKLS